MVRAFLPMKNITRIINTLITRRLVFVFDKVEFSYTCLSFKRLKNWFLAEIAYRLKLVNVPAYPTHLQVEPSNICNLRCPLCHVVTDHKPRGYLQLEDFKKLMDEVGDYLLFLHFWGWGEPFMNSDFFSMIRYAKSKGLKIITSTNGHFFEDDKNIDQLIDSGLDVLIFALDGLDEKTYEQYRAQGDLQKAMRGLKRLLERRRQRGALFPRVNLRMLVTRDNEGQVETMKEFARESGADIFSLKTMCGFDNSAEAGERLPCNREYRRFEYDDFGKPIRKKNRCKKMWNHPTVYLDGSVVPCDYYTGEELFLGKVFPASGGDFWRVWNGEDYKRLRRRFLKGDTRDFRCGHCAMNYADVDRCVSHAFKI
ncbi:MAG TPA: hypothetical protein DCL35_03475 [Candidatus Omnitrophica bacterium]|nr:hypothetical protein [Candidatus Omnitrophota bacterium]